MPSPKKPAPGTPEPTGAAGRDDERTDVDLDTTAPKSSPHMPHERDERVGMTGGVPSERVQQGARDLKRGVQDTSRSTEADQAYARQKKK